MLATVADAYNFNDEEFESIINMEIGKTMVVECIVITRNPDVWPQEPTQQIKHLFEERNKTE